MGSTIESKIPFIKLTIANRSASVHRFERKFFIVPNKIGFAYSLLRQICRPDGEFPESNVTSLYFDTADMEQYEKSISGSYDKDKVRIRWYDEDRIKAGETVPIYVELKSKMGYDSFKQREKIPVPAEKFALSRLREGIIPKTRLNDIVAGFGYFPALPLRPIIKISYRRFRLNEILTGTRVSLDYDIHSTMIAPELGYREKNVRLEGAVLEIKGNKLELPPALVKLRLLDTDWTRFSKYGSCIESHTTDPGSIARFSPSGRILNQ